MHCVSHWAYKSKPLPDKAVFGHEDVTVVVVPMIHNAMEELRPSLQSIITCRPAEVMLVTMYDKREALERLAALLDHGRIRVLHTPFQDARMGGVGTCQRVKRVRSGAWTTRVWNWLGAAYIERRNFEISATHNVDGGTSCMSGCTGTYRSEILKSHEFQHGF